MKQTEKLFVGGLEERTTETDVANYFAKFSTVIFTQLMFDKETKASRRFGFVVVEGTGNNILNKKPHFIHNKQIEVKVAVSKEVVDIKKKEKQEKTAEKGKLEDDSMRKLFVGGLRPCITERDLVEKFVVFGEIEECFIKRLNNVSRGFGFLIFSKNEALNKVLEFIAHSKIKIKGYILECKQATPRKDLLKESKDIISGAKMSINSSNSSHSKEWNEESKKSYELIETKDKDFNQISMRKNSSSSLEQSFSTINTSYTFTPSGNVFGEALLFNTNLIIEDVYKKEQYIEEIIEDFQFDHNLSFALDA